MIVGRSEGREPVASTKRRFPECQTLVGACRRALRSGAVEDRVTEQETLDQIRRVLRRAQQLMWIPVFAILLMVASYGLTRAVAIPLRRPFSDACASASSSCI